MTKRDRWRIVWDNEVHIKDKSDLLDCTVQIAEAWGIGRVLGLSMDQLHTWMEKVYNGYKTSNVSYHTIERAVQVLSCLSIYVVELRGNMYLNQNVMVMLFFAAVGIDLGHPSISNKGLVKGKHELASLFDHPILESYHISLLLKSMKKEGVLNNLNEKDRNEIMQGIQVILLHTDLDDVCELMDGVSSIVQKGNLERVPKAVGGDDRLLLAGFFLHAANVSSLIKPWAVSSQWNDKLHGEMKFECEYLRKKQVGSSHVLNYAAFQVQLLTNTIIPSMKVLAKIIPDADYCQTSAKNVLLKWKTELNYKLSERQRNFIQLVVLDEDRRLTEQLASPRPIVPNNAIGNRLQSWFSQVKVTRLVYVLTVYALFAQDLKTAFLSKEYDFIFDYATITVFSLLSLEIMYSSSVNPQYFKSFYFCLDVICTFSLLADVSFAYGDDSGEVSSNSYFLIKPVKMFRASQSIRVVRLIRLFRITQFFRTKAEVLRRLSFDNATAKVTDTILTEENLKQTFGCSKEETLTTVSTHHVQLLVDDAFRDADHTPPRAAEKLLSKVRRGRRYSLENRNKGTMQDIPLASFLSVLNRIYALKSKKYGKRLKIEYIHPQLKNGPSVLGKQFTDLAIRRVIVLVISLLLFTPHFSALKVDVNQAEAYGLEKLHNTVLTHPTGFDDPVIAGEISTFSEFTKPLYLKLEPLDQGTIANIVNKYTGAEMKSMDKIFQTFRDPELRFHTIGGCTLRNLQPCSTVAIFDVREYTKQEALYGILKTFMITICFMFGSYVLTHDTNVAVVQPVERMVALVQQLSENPLSKLSKSPEHTASYEIKLLEDTLTKIAGLLQVGFGEAGASIISRNIQEGGSFHSFEAGNKVYAIFGFCNINSFADITECLREEVMLFVNIIGQIVHRSVHEHNGKANRNLGDAFLLVWKLPQNTHNSATYINRTKPPEHLDNDGGPNCRKQSYRGFLTTNNDSLANKAVLAFLSIMNTIASKDSLKQYEDHPMLCEKFSLPFKVSMGFGLHIGWAIEGTIGSKFKIDASYLAPDVNMASRLDAATRQFGIPFLMSHSLYNCLSINLQHMCRIIDCVLVKGSTEPIGLYTFDIDPLRHIEFNGMEEVAKLQSHLHPEFLCTFDAGVTAYFKGNWSTAKDCLERVLVSLKPNDGPSSVLLRVLKANNYQAPEDWKGYRALTAK